MHHHQNKNQLPGNLAEAVEVLTKRAVAGRARRAFVKSANKPSWMETNVYKPLDQRFGMGLDPAQKSMATRSLGGLGLGLGGGALLGLGQSLMQPKRKRNMLNSMATGSLLGGTLGASAGFGSHFFKTPPAVAPQPAPQPSLVKDVVNQVGNTVTNTGNAIIGGPNPNSTKSELNDRRGWLNSFWDQWNPQTNKQVETHATTARPGQVHISTAALEALPPEVRAKIKTDPSAVVKALQEQNTHNITDENGNNTYINPDNIDKVQDALIPNHGLPSPTGSTTLDAAAGSTAFMGAAAGGIAARRKWLPTWGEWRNSLVKPDVPVGPADHHLKELQQAHNTSSPAALKARVKAGPESSVADHQLKKNTRQIAQLNQTAPTPVPPNWQPVSPQELAAAKAEEARALKALNQDRKTMRGGLRDHHNTFRKSQGPGKARTIANILGALGVVGASAYTAQNLNNR